MLMTVFTDVYMRHWAPTSQYKILLDDEIQLKLLIDNSEI